MITIQDNTTESRYQILTTKCGQPILDVSKSTYGSKQIDCGTYRDRQPDNGWGEIKRSNLDLTPAIAVSITPALRQTLLEDLAYTYGSNTNKFTEKLKEFGFITIQ